MDFLAFSYNGVHSFDDLGIYRVSSGDRYENSLSPEVKDNIMEVTGGDGAIRQKSRHGSKKIDVHIAFDNLTESGLEALSKTFRGDQEAPLWFEECPYKVYLAKVASSPEIKFVPFQQGDETIYKGEGTISFVCYSTPYARTPDCVDTDDYSGKLISSYQGFQNYEKWRQEDLLSVKDVDVVVKGDVPCPFYLELTGTLYNGAEVVVTDSSQNSSNPTELCSIVLSEEVGGILWNSETGLVLNSSSKKPVKYTGLSRYFLPLGAKVMAGVRNNDNIVPNTNKLTFNFWYY